MEFEKNLEALGPDSIEQFSISQIEKTGKAAVLENQQDIKVCSFQRNGLNEVSLSCALIVLNLV